MPRGRWVELDELYDLVAASAVLTVADQEPEAPGATAPRWKRNVRNYLQARKGVGEIEWDGAARYRFSPEASPPSSSGLAGYGQERWTLEPGDDIRRGELHDRYGGSRQGGTIPSRSSPNIFLFLDRGAAAEHGYYDGWVGDHLYYTGHGQRGDQQFHAGNAAVLRHRDDARAIRVFRGARRTVTYLGQFELDMESPYFLMEAAEPETGAPRQVIVFRLKPLGGVIHDAQDALEFPEGMTAPEEVERAVTSAAGPLVTRVPIEEQHVEEVEVARTADSYVATRREQTLVLTYTSHLEAAGSVVSRFRVQPPGEARAIVCDIHDETRNNLIEAKGVGTRGEVRMAVGQLLDYSRFLDPAPALAVLLPQQPRQDLEALLDRAGVAAVWPSAGGFADNAGGRFA